MALGQRRCDFWSMVIGMALEKAPVLIKALTGKEKLSGTEKGEVRGFEERMLIKGEELGIILDKEREIWAMCDLLSFLDWRLVDLRHSGVSSM